jgi:hypothetical protein
MRRRGARPVRRRGPGKRAGGNTSTAPRADPYHVNIRLEEHKLCLLVLIVVRADGRKELVALACVPQLRRASSTRIVALTCGNAR